MGLFDEHLNIVQIEYPVTTPDIQHGPVETGALALVQIVRDRIPCGKPCVVIDGHPHILGLLCARSAGSHKQYGAGQSLQESLHPLEDFCQDVVGGCNKRLR